MNESIEESDDIENPMLYENRSAFSFSRSIECAHTAMMQKKRTRQMMVIGDLRVDRVVL